MNKVTPEMKARMQELRDQKYAYWKIAKELGVSATIVKYHLDSKYKASMNKYGTEWLKAHPEYNRERSNRHYRLHPEQVTASIKESRRRQRLKVIAMLGGKCSRCGNNDPRVLQINHIHGQGKVERAKYGDVTSFYRSILRGENIDKLNLLCGNCNWLYDYETGARSEPTQLHSEVIELLGGACTRCDNSNARVLQVNHLEGGGGREWEDKHRQLYSSIMDKTRRVDDLNVLCSNCNLLYEYERKNKEEL